MGHLLVTKTCADIKRHDWGWLPDDVCESRLRQDKRSAAAKHPRDLALIAMSLASTPSSTRKPSAIPVCSAMVYGYNNKLQAGAQHQLAPVDYFDCARRLRRGTAKCWFRVINTPDVKKLVIKEVYEALYRTELVAAHGRRDARHRDQGSRATAMDLGRFNPDRLHVIAAMFGVTTLLGIQV
ncbi:hypothetical protein HU200_059450 [Digitaria exilis]|uniref:Uncharacterized protein n=1 Tax=Digitaria exilis TaxID=1010633 RepID=A0A835AAN0_9POAL|nr:hypothetical protein HU200_059450 [Digitaria exilis]